MWKLLCLLAWTPLLLTQSCVGVGSDDVSDEHFYQLFVDDAKVMQEMGLPVYWLGREFSVESTVFRGPHGAEFGDEVQGGGVRMSYLPQGGNTPVYVTVYSRDAWELVSDRMMNPRTPGASRRSVSVLGKPAELLSSPGGQDPSMHSG